MDKIIEALSSLLPEDQIGEVKNAVSEYLENAKTVLEAEYTEKLEEAYVELHSELKNSEDTAVTGYKEAYSVIQDLYNRLEIQKNEYEKAIDEGYEEAYQMLISERGKNENIELDVYEASEDKLAKMKEYMVEKVNSYLEYKSQELYEQARRDVLNDPRMVEHKIALDRVVETVQGYISDEDYAIASSSKIEEANTLAADLKGKMRILEARNVRLDVENKKLDEQVRHAAELISEATANERKARAGNAKNVQGRGRSHTEDVEIISEHNVAEPTPQKNVDNTLVESFDPEELHKLQVLAGTKLND